MRNYRRHTADHREIKFNTIFDHLQRGLVKALRQAGERSFSGLNNNKIIFVKCCKAACWQKHIFVGFLFILFPHGQKKRLTQRVWSDAREDEKQTINFSWPYCLCCTGNLCISYTEIKRLGEICCRPYGWCEMFEYDSVMAYVFLLLTSVYNPILYKQRTVTCLNVIMWLASIKKLLESAGTCKTHCLQSRLCWGLRYNEAPTCDCILHTSAGKGGNTVSMSTNSGLLRYNWKHHNHFLVDLVVVVIVL